MAALDFPITPTTNDTFLGGNGVTYQFDGEKWRMYTDPAASQSSLWARDSLNTDVYPATPGDDINVKNGSNVVTGSLNADGSIDFITLNIDSLPSLP